MRGAMDKTIIQHQAATTKAREECSKLRAEYYAAEDRAVQLAGMASATPRGTPDPDSLTRLRAELRSAAAMRALRS